MEEFLTQNLNQHYDQLRENKRRYTAHLIYIFSENLFLPREFKSKVIAAVISANDPELLELMAFRSTIVDLRDALRILKTQKNIPKLTSKRKVVINKFYLGRLSQSKLHYHILKYSGEAFREVIDLTHPHPTIFQDSDFQSVVFGENKGVIGEIRKILNAEPSEEDVIKLMETYSIPWHYLKQRVQFGEKVYKKLIETESLPVLLRQINRLDYHDLIEKKLLETDKVRMNFFEIYSTWKQQLFSNKGQDKLVNLCEIALKDSVRNFPNMGKVAIVGDISPSMEFAAEFSIMLSLVLGMAYEDSSLFFFHRDCIEADIPTDFYSATQLVARTRTASYTAPATVIDKWIREYYSFDTVIVITDEEENRPSQNGRGFAQEWKLYNLYNPLTKLLFLTVGDSRYMTDDLTHFELEATRIQIPDNVATGFKMLQAILVSLAHPGLFEIQLSVIEKALDSNPVKEVQMTVNRERSYFVLSELIVTIKDLCVLSDSGTRTFEKEIRTEATKLAIVLRSLGFVSDEQTLRNLDYSAFDTVELFLEELSTKIKLM
ncbi:hypothetical protein LCGC14_0194990 [marine sediment metagenome]|uniref:Uncharacterized protein n=1 Tax=marine sediment metagenome TaxID=412755 RepID=A0A0F9X494_9ZZZZ